MIAPLQKRSRVVSEITADDLKGSKLWVVVFGPGHGEAILVRLPDGRVGVVDGCREREEECPVTRLLRGLAVKRLHFVCMTHPHDDHYKGLARLLTTYKGGVDHVWHALAMTDHERNALIRSADQFYAAAKTSQRKGKGSRKILRPDSESRRSLEDVLFELVRAGNLATSPARRRQLVVGRPLLAETVLGAEFAIEAWGPTDDDVLEVMARFLTKARKAKTKQSDLPNMVSGALLVRWGDARTLLAGDLFADKHPHRGWSPALDRARHLGKVQVVNVAHHASENAHDERLWAAMSPELALVTPFQRARREKGKLCYPPRPGDLRRYLDQNAEVVVTSRPEWLSVPGYRPRPSTSQRTPVSLTSSRLLNAVAAPEPTDTNNAVAVALDETGNITDVILAGEAAFYT